MNCPVLLNPFLFWIWQQIFKQTCHPFALADDLILFELQEAEVNISIPDVEGREDCQHSLTELSRRSTFLSMEAGVRLWQRGWEKSGEEEQQKLSQSERNPEHEHGKIKHFCRVAGDQQESDKQRLLVVLEIRGPYYHCLCYRRALHRGKECPLDPHTSKALTRIPFILLILACPSSSHSAPLWLISLFASLKRSSCVLVCHRVINMMGMC